MQSPGSIPDLKKYWIKHFPLKKNIRKIKCLKTSVQVKKNYCINLKIINNDLHIFVGKKKIFDDLFFQHSNSTFPKFSKETIKKLFSPQQNFFLSRGGG